MNKIGKAVEKRFLKIRGWKNWAEYDRVQESSELDKNVRKELISVCIEETLNVLRDKIDKWIDHERKIGTVIGFFSENRLKESLFGDDEVRRPEGKWGRSYVVERVTE